MLIAEDPAASLQRPPQQSLGLLEAALQAVAGGGKARGEQGVVVIVPQDAAAEFQRAGEHPGGLLPVPAIEAMTKVVHGGQGLRVLLPELAALHLQGRSPDAAAPCDTPPDRYSRPPTI